MKMCVTSLLCGPRADLLPFYGFLCKRLSLCIKKTFIQPFIFLFIFVGYRNDRFFSHTNPYILNVTQQCRCSPMLIFRAWTTCAYTKEKLQWALDCTENAIKNPTVEPPLLKDNVSKYDCTINVTKST